MGQFFCVFYRACISLKTGASGRRGVVRCGIAGGYWCITVFRGGFLVVSTAEWELGVVYGEMGVRCSWTI